MTRTSSTKRSGRKTRNLANAVQERLDTTPERLARASDAGQEAIRDGERLRRRERPRRRRVRTAG